MNNVNIYSVEQYEYDKTRKSKQSFLGTMRLQKRNRYSKVSRTAKHIFDDIKEVSESDEDLAEAVP